MKKKKKTGTADNIPGEIVFGVLVLSVTGNKEIEIQNYRGILEYTDEILVIQGKKQILVLRGSDFLIEYFTNEVMKVKGCVRQIEYHDGRSRYSL